MAILGTVLFFLLPLNSKSTVTSVAAAQEFQPPVPREAEQPEKPPSLLGQLRGRDTKAAKAELAGEKPPACREALNEIPQQVLDDTLSRKVVGHIRGDKQWESSPLEPAPAFASQKGNKDLGYDAPNQDNFSVTRFRNGFTLACVADGHGRYGHVASTRAVQAIPFLLHTEGGFDKESLDEERVEELLVSAFEKANSDIIALLRSGRTGRDVRTSGTTVVAALWKGATLWAANLGDSRLIVGTQVDEKLLLETQDHKPEKSEERARIERTGGEVRAPVYSDGSISVPRVFLPGQGSPGLAISRTLGDQTAKGIGVIPTPEVSKMTLESSRSPSWYWPRTACGSC